MSRRNWVVAGLLAVLVALVVGVPSTAFAAYTNPDCVACHTTANGVAAAQDFGVGAVDFTTACKKCHDDSLAGTHPYHNPTANCGSSCHPGWGASLVSAVPNYMDARGYGVFAGADSADTDPALLHLIHSKPRWMEAKESSFSKCGSCHAVATCDSCHDNPPAPDDATHLNHAASLSLSPWMGNTSSGVTNGDQTENTYVLNNAILCGAAACHDTAGVANSTPGLLDDKSHVANPASGYLANTVTKVGTWAVMYSNAYTLGQISQSNATNATLSVAFTGEQFILVSDKDPYRGIAEVLVDNVSQGTVDLYNDTTINQVEVFKSAVLASGPHTIKIRVTGTKRAAARATYVRVDQFKVYSSAPGDVAPTCASCHPDRTALHDPNALGSFSHEASPTGGNLYSGYRCDSCHSMEFRGEHNKITSSTTGQLCSSCHETWARDDQGISGEWVSTDGCNFRQCHVAASPREPHTGYAGAHAVTTDAAEASCRGCHAGDLVVIHSNSVAGSFVTNCNTCHKPTSTATSKSCVDPACHVGTGIFSTDAHAFNVTKHTATPWTAATQGASPAVAAGGLECSVCHSARVDTAHATTSLGAVSCSSGGTGNTGCHDNVSLTGRATATATWPTNKCTECHSSGANVTHNTLTPDHAVSAGTCAGTGTSCHTPTSLMTMHSQSQSGGAPNYSSCADSGCHSAGNKDKRPSLVTCGTGNSCHTDKTPSNHGVDHAYTAASNYSQTTSETVGGESGCAGSGAACHGAAGSGDGVTDFHAAKTSGCTSTDKCHGSSSMDATFKAAGSGTDCVRCHAGGFVNGTDASPLSSLSPSGHYGDTTHTATGGLGNVTSGGTASAACSTCHSLSLKDAHGAARTGFSSTTKGAYVTCQECHGYSVGMSAVVTGNWAGKACSACHTGTAGLAGLAHTTTAPVVNEVTTTCGSTTGLNCHVTTDLHALHKNAAGGCNLSGCHDYTKQGYVPTAKSCGTGGTCHGTYTKTTHTHTVGGDAAKHQPSSSVPASDTTYYSTQCGQCHDMRTSGSSLTTEHALATSAKTTNADTCLNCHNNVTPAVTTAITNNWSAKNTAGTGATSSCGVCHQSGALAIHVDTSSTAHADVVSTGCSSTGPGCHNSSDLSQVGPVTTVNTNIHSSCLRCHDREATATTWTSAMLTTPANMKWNPALDTCGGTECHLAANYNPAAGATQYYHRIGQANVVTGDDTKHTANAAYMASAENSGTATNVCSDCHIGTLASEHATTGPAATPTKVGCTTGGYAGNTAGCHNTTTGSVAASSAAMVKNGWNSGTKTCQNCHSAKHNAIGTSHTGTSTQSCGTSGNGCHTSYDLVALHKSVAGGGGCRLSGCHDAANKSQRPAKKSCGTGQDCHTAFTPTAGHRANTITGSETPTHTVAAASMLATEGVYSAGNYNDSRTCDTCHFSTMGVEHTSSSVGTVGCTTGGTGNTGCHNQATPVNGTNVIKNTNWQATRLCTDCHGGSNGPAKHNSVVSGHVGTHPGWTCSNAGCHDTTDLRVIHAKKAYSTGCSQAADANSPFACHATQGVVPTQKSCGQGNSGCHTDKNDTGHGIKHSMVVANSNYTDGSGEGVEAGCLNANAGCHNSLGTNNTSTNIANYHQTSLCATSVCHTSASKPTHTQPFVCGDCHDSSYVGAIDTTSLATLAPAGHYGDTTHTATGGLGNVGVTGGTAVEACSVCHDLSLKTAHTNIVSTTKGTKVTCGECHGYNINVINEIKTGNWTTNSCSDCHNVTNMPTVIQHATTVATTATATGSAGCSASGVNCHNTTDLHQIHRNAATGCDLAGCHDAAAKNKKPTGTSCGSAGVCHTTGYNTNTSFGTHANSTETTDHAPVTTTQQTQTFLGNSCNACHVVAKTDGGLVTEHGLSTSTMTVNAGNVCRNCHNNSSAAVASAIATGWGTPNNLKDTSGACGTCHTGTLATHADANTGAHTKTNTGCASTGPGCHNSGDLSQVGAVTTVNTNIHSTCLRCHDRTGSASWTNAMLTTPGNVKWSATANTCGAATGCHTSGYYNPAAGATQYYHRIGQANVVTGDDTKHTANAAYMASSEDSGTALNVCSDCHIGTLASEHATTSIAASPIKVGCTSSTNGGYAGNTQGCHNTTTGAIAPASASMVKNGWNGGTKTCANCHSAKHNAIATSHTGTSTQGCGASGNGCHNTYDLAALHKGRVGGGGCKLAGCHDATNKSQRPSLKTCGTGQACHTTYTATAGHRANTITGTDTTHTATGASMAVKVDGTTYDIGGGNLCSNCHSSALKSAHTTTTASLGSGRTAWTTPFCANCHNSEYTSVPSYANSVTTIKTNLWNLQTCDQCHVTNGSGKHNTYTAGTHTATLGTAGTADGCAGASCHGTADVRVIHNKATRGCTSSGNDSKGTNPACHALDKQMTAGPKCGSGSGGCHINHTNSNHVTAHTLDTTASAYSNTTITGCTGAGAGCHGASAASYETTQFHPVAGVSCSTGKCHDASATNHNNAAFDGTISCLVCHGQGSSTPTTWYVNAPVVSVLTTTTGAAKGHYNETTHTAGSQTATVSAGGTASAACSACHSGVSAGIDGLSAQHQGLAASQVTNAAYTDMTCSECHSYSVGISAVITGKWPTKTCGACHSGSAGMAPIQHSATAPVVTGTSTLGCGATGVNCHTTYDLHAIHKNSAAGCNQTNCHDATKQGVKPTLKSCGTGNSCHTTYTVATTYSPATHTKSAETTDHAPTNTTQETATWQSVACGSCHNITKADGGLAAEHGSTTSTRTTHAGSVCLNCHNNPNAGLASAIATGWGSPGMAKNTTGACATCHVTGFNPIHTTLDTAKHTKTNTGCASTGVGCHPTSELSQVGTPTTTNNIHSTCLRCHDHTGAASWTNAMLTTPGNLKYTPSATTCGQATGCHTSGYYSTVTQQHRIGQANVVTGDDTKHTADAAYMASTENSGTALNVCSDCHIGTLASEHATTGPAASAIKIGCTSVTNGGYAGNTAGCHNTNTGLIAANSATMVKNNWNSGTKTCANCHSAKHNAIATSHTGTSTQGCGASGNGCHTTYDLAAIHRGRAGGGGCKLSGCHDATNKSQRPAKKTCGSGQTCHTTYTATAGHRASTITGDDTTHTATGASMAVKVDGTTYDTGGGNVCSSCHSSTLKTAHTTVTASLGSGRTAWTTPYCANCHNSEYTSVPSYANSVTTIKTNLWNLQTCDQCHVTNGSGKHNTYTTGTHTATLGTAGTADGCAGASCHGTADVRVIHNKAAAGCTSNGNDSKGTNPACHALDKQMTAGPKCGSGSGGCHTSHTNSNHGPVHDIMSIVPTATQVAGGSYVYHGTTYTSGNSYGCSGCHFSDLIKEHGTSASGGAGHTFDDATVGVGCGVCHTDKGGTVGTDASKSAITGAITLGVSTTGDQRCVTCHNGNMTTGTTAPHAGTATTAGSTAKAGANPIAEFVDDGYKSGGHNIGTTNYSKESPDNNGATSAGVVTWTYRGTFTGTNPRTGAVWTKTDKLLCSDCHRFNAGNALVGPQGAAALYEVLTSNTTTATAGTKAYMTGAAPYNVTGANAPGLCGKCHLALSSTPHTNNSNHNQPCVYCHRAIPHSSPRPRLLVGSADVAPYKATMTQGMDIANTGTGANKTSCSNKTGTNGCTDHGGSAPYW